jgi:uncharacterized protein YuzE
MKLTFDPENRIGYLRLANARRSEPVRTAVVSDDLVVDVTDFGTVVGIEFLDANAQFGLSLTVKNESTGESVELPLREIDAP